MAYAKCVQIDVSSWNMSNLVVEDAVVFIDCLLSSVGDNMLGYLLCRMQVKPSSQPAVVSIPICHYDGQLS